MSSRNLVSAVSWLSFGNVMVRALSLFTMPVLTRHLSPDGYGTAALVGTVVSLSSVVALAGVDMGYSRHIFSGQAGTAASVEAYCWRWALASSAVVAMLAGVLWWSIAARIGMRPSAAGFVVAGVFFSAMMTMAQTRARLGNRYARLSWVQFATGCAAAGVSVGTALVWRQDAWPLLLAMVAGYLLPVLLLGMPDLGRLVSASGLARPQARNVLYTGIAGFVTAPAYWALASSDRWFLAAYRDSTAVGIYSIGVTVGTVGAVVSTAITSAWLPELSREESAAGGRVAASKGRAIRVLVAILLIVAVAVAASGGDVIRALADVHFHAAAQVVPLLAAGVMFYGVMHVGNALLVMKGKLHWAAVAWVIALVVSLGLNSWLIPRYGALGAALTQSASFFVVMVLVWAAVLRCEPLPLDRARLLAGFAFAAGAAVLMARAWGAVPWVSLLLKLPVGVMFSLVCAWIVAPGALGLGWRGIRESVDVWSGRGNTLGARG